MHLTFKVKHPISFDWKCSYLRARHSLCSTSKQFYFDLGSTHIITLQSPWHCQPAKTINNKIVSTNNQSSFTLNIDTIHTSVYDVSVYSWFVSDLNGALAVFMRKYFRIIILESQSISFIRIGIILLGDVARLLFEWYGYQCSTSFVSHDNTIIVSPLLTNRLFRIYLSSSFINSLNFAWNRVKQSKEIKTFLYHTYKWNISISMELSGLTVGL